MKSTLIKCAALITGVVASVSCMTTYDAYGRPVQTVDPGAAAAGVAAAGVIGYAIGRDVEDGHRPRYYGHHHHRRGYYR